MDEKPFARAHRAIDAHDVDAVRALLDRFPAIVSERGANGNDLLGFACGTCDERLVALLLERDADPSSANVHGWTALHQAAYKGLPLLVRMLLGAGAPVATSARGDGGTPLVVALFWGHVEAAELLAERDLAPGNLRVAAGLGRLGLIERLVPHEGEPTAAAGAHRGFYRPHSGFPAWQPSDAPVEIVDEALAWAARNGRLDALDLLVERGARVDADVYRGTALAWAAVGGRVDTIERLFALGADPDARTTFGGPDHGEGATALHLAVESGKLEAIRVLLDGGADQTLRDARYDGTAADWAEHLGRTAALELLRAEG